MIKEALGFLFDRGREAAVIQNISLGRDKTLHLFPDGTTKEVERDNALINASIVTPLSLCEAIRKFSWNGGGAEIWINDREVVVIIDASTHRREFLVMQIAHSEAMNHLRRKGFSLDQKELTKWIRRILPADGTQEMIDGIKNVDFQRIQQSRSKVQRGDESFGKSVEARVQNIDEIPESMNVKIPLFDYVGLKGLLQPVEVHVDIDMDNERFDVWVHNQDLNRLESEAFGQLFKFFDDELEGAAKIFHGSPTLKNTEPSEFPF